MSDYEQLVKALRCCIVAENSVTICEMVKCPYFYRGIDCENELLADAAAAIEELLESVGMLGEQRSYWIDKAAEYYNQLPKAGEFRRKK